MVSLHLFVVSAFLLVDISVVDDVLVDIVVVVFVCGKDDVSNIWFQCASCCADGIWENCTVGGSDENGGGGGCKSNGLSCGDGPLLHSVCGQEIGIVVVVGSV